MKSNDSGSSIAITFLIGNGFDLALGLKTRYRNFLELYTEKKEKASDTSKAVKWLVDRIQLDSDLWADAEAAWGELPYSEAQKEDRDLTPQKIIDEAISDFQYELVDYLKNQMNRIQIETAERDTVRKHFLQALVGSLRLVDMDRHLQKALDSGYRLDFRFVTFNITDTLEKLLGEYSSTEEISVPDKNGNTIPVRIVSICHVHGSITIPGSMIFGLDNLKQIKDAKARDYCRKTAALIKPATNRRLQFKYEQAGKKAIAQGRWIVCFGLSFGTTDWLWWKYLYGKIATPRSKVRIVLHPHFSKFRPYSPAQNKLRITNELQERFFAAAGTPDPSSKVRDNVLVARHYPHTDFDGNDSGYCDPLCLGWFKKHCTLGADDQETLNENFMAAEQGDAKVQFKLGVRYHLGFGVPVDKKKAVEWYQKAADKGHVEAMYNLGVCYDHGTGVAKDEREAVKWYQKAADKGHAEAMNNLGWCYEHGEGVAKDEREAVKWYQKAADKGNEKAMYNLALCYAKGTGVAKDEHKAVEWYQKAVDKGLAEAMYNLGVCHMNGVGVKKDEHEAVKLWRKAADKGNAEAMFNLGLCYAKGEGVARNAYKSVEWWQKAADKGLAKAMYNLGVCYAAGIGVKKDLDEAEKWLRKEEEWYQKAADKGDVEAMFALGVCYAAGIGVEKDLDKAEKWLRKAVEAGVKEAQEPLEEVLKEKKGK